MFDSWYLNNRSDDGNQKVGDVPLAPEEVPPIDSKAYEDLEEQNQSDNRLCCIDEGPAEVAHVGASHHLRNESESYHEHPYPRGLVVQTFETAHALFLVLVLGVFFFDLFSSKRASLTFFADDLEGGCDDCDQ
jgi:hypothetical protein